MWSQTKWGTSKDELWNQCMALTRMDCWTLSQQEKQMYLMFIFNSSDNLVCCVQGCNCVNSLLWNTRSLLWNSCKKNETHPPTPPALPLHPKKKKKNKNQQQQKVCSEGLLGLEVIVNDSHSEQSSEKDKEHCLEKKKNKAKQNHHRFSAVTESQDYPAWQGPLEILSNCPAKAGSASAGCWGLHLVVFSMSKNRNSIIFLENPF